MADWSESVIEDIVFGKFGENHDHRMSYDGGISVEEQLTVENDVGQTADYELSKGEGVLWVTEGSSIYPPQEIGSSSIASGLQNNTCNTNNPTAVRGTEEEKDLSVLSFDHDTSASLKLPFMENENDREIDLLYYDWSDISNFEDVDKMFRNGDPTFGQWSNTDRPWISSSSNDIFGQEDTFTSGFESSTLEFRDMNDSSSYCANVKSIPESRTKNVVDNKQSYWNSQSCELVTKAEQAYDGGGKGENKSALTTFGYVTGLNELEPQMNIQTQKLNSQFSSDINGKGIAPYSQPISKQNCFMESDSSSYINALNPGAHMGNKLQYQDPFLPTMSSTITDCKQSSSSFEVSAHVIGRTPHGLDNDSLLKDPVMKLKEIVDKPGIGPTDIVNSVKRQHDDIEQGIHTDRGNTNIELYSTDVASSVGKSSTIPLVFSDELSVKAISFQQLQDTVGQLDLRTKLCIRDSLYRLARSAEQRHRFTVANNGNIECRRGLHGTGTLRNSVDYVEMETQTNPIDRSVAHLLFHRAPESTTVSLDTMLLESQMTFYHPIMFRSSLSSVKGWELVESRST